MRLLLPALLATVAAANAQTLDFETLPDGTPTVDLMEIGDQYATPPFNVRFRILSRVTGQVIGTPNIAKVGAPRTAFFGCASGQGNGDRPASNAGVCESFLTDDTMIGASGDLEVTYVVPVARLAGTILDVDQNERWTIEAFDANGTMIAAEMVERPNEAPCGGGRGNGTASVFSIESPTGAEEISRILFRYTGGTGAGAVGLAFDNFSPSESGLGSDPGGCPAADNSTGLPGITFARGSVRVQDNELRLGARGLPSQVMGYFLGSQQRGFVMNPAGATGNLCLLNPVSRFNRSGEIQDSGLCGRFDLTVDLSNLPTPTGVGSVLAGESWTFQAWFRDLVPQPNSNFASAVTIDFI